MLYGMSRVAASVPVLSVKNVHKSFVGGDGTPLDILLGIDLDLELGERIAITGASGTGKSTLLHILGSLDRPSSGRVLVEGKEVSELSEDELSEVRNKYVGFVFQFHHLLREFTALENVMMPALIAGMDRSEARDRSRQLLEEVGVIGRDLHKPRQLSGGEQQRVAVARALVNQPLVLLADEPSGNLDTQTSLRLHNLLYEVRSEREFSMVVVTHNLDLAGRADRILVLREGRLEPADYG